MSPPHLERSGLTVALIGNPNTGKSTLFTALVGVHQHVGNYPGVTVEKKTGRMEHAGRRYEVIDLPGLYSLAPRSRDEMLAVDVLLGRRKDSPPVDAVVCLADAGNLERSLYLASQVLEMGLPVVLAVNMLDVAERRGIRVNLERLQDRLPVPVVGIQANRRTGIPRLKDVLASVIAEAPPRFQPPFPETFHREVDRLQSLMADRKPQTGRQARLPRYLLERLLLDADGYLEGALLDEGDGEFRRQLLAGRDRLAKAGCALPGVETAARYGWAGRILEGAVTQPPHYKTTATDRIDRLLTHRFWGTLVFGLLMVLVFQAVFAWAETPMRLIGAATETAGAWIEAHLPQGALRSLLVDGVVSGVGSVLSFLPQILILFLFIAVLEDCGYMARAAFLMDKTMVRVGLCGRSFIPMLCSFACAVPGIMATRVIENERDRLTTILVAPLMTCSARLPIYALLIAAFVPQRGYLGGALSLQGLTLLGLYLLGIVTAVVAATVLKRTILRGQTPPFLMELPSYKWPSPRTVAYRVVQRGWLFVRCAGTVILAVSVVFWAALYFPHDAEVVEGPFQGRREALESQLASPATDHSQREALQRELAELDNQIAAAYQRHSLLGRFGRTIEPLVKPLGWDWRIGCAVVASLPAREIVVAAMGVIYSLGEEVDVRSGDHPTELQARLRSATWEGTERPVFTLPVALSILVFFALCPQCAATLAAIGRETNSWRWPAFTFAYMTVLAYLGALLTYRLGTWIETCF